MAIANDFACVLIYGNFLSSDAIALHWYGDGLGSFYDYIWSAHGQFPDYNIWITEFASTNSDTAG